MSYYYLILAADDSIRGLILLIALIYLVVLVWLAMYGVSNLINTLLYLRVKPALRAEKPAKAPKHWPSITVQLPIYNEKYTVERLLRAVTQLDYPPDRIQFQVLDDSTDDTATLVKRLVDDYKAQGLNIE